MTALAILLLAWLGSSFNLAFASSMVQPDWALALLLGSLLAHRANWVWVLPGIAMHDLIFHWSLWVCLPIAAAIPLVLIYLDEHLGVGLPQRLFMLLLVTMMLLPWGWSVQAWLLTVGLTVPAWFVLRKQYAYAT